MTGTVRPQRLTIYLAKASGVDPRTLIEKPTALRHVPIDADPDSRIDLYIPPPTGKQPRWASFFDSYVPPATFGKTRSVGALLTVCHKDRVFALTFGTGRFHLKQDCWEESFGLHVALNCIGDNIVKSIDKHTLDTLSRHTREQASREATASEFGLDVEQDLLRAVTGTPSEPGFGKWLTGADTLQLSVPVAIGDLQELMGRLYEKHLDDSYKKNFPWVDQIAQVRDPDVQSTLDALLIDELRSDKRKHVWMAVPEVIAWDEVAGFRFPGSGGPKVQHHDIHVAHFLESLKDASKITEDLIKTRLVESVDAEGNVLKRWKVYKCLYCELDLDDSSYLLSAGTWYRVRNSFVKQVNDAVAAIPQYEVTLPEYDHDSEGTYIKHVAKQDRASFAVMDNDPIRYGGGASSVEFCDLFTLKKDLIHIKRYGQSAALSHLFAQGLTSGELFHTDADFRKVLNEKLPHSHRLQDPATRLKQGEYRVIFAVVSDRSGPLVLPFFSRLNLKHAVRRLEGYGFRVALAKISVNETRAKVKKVKSRSHAA